MAAQSDSRARGNLLWGWQCPSPLHSPPRGQHPGCTSGPPPPAAHTHPHSLTRSSPKLFVQLVQPPGLIWLSNYDPFPIMARRAWIKLCAI